MQTILLKYSILKTPIGDLKLLGQNEVIYALSWIDNMVALKLPHLNKSFVIEHDQKAFLYVQKELAFGAKSFS